MVKPKRAVPPLSAAGRSRTSIRNAGVEERRPPRTARNCGRDLRVCRIGIRASRADGSPKLAGNRDKMRVWPGLYHDARGRGVKVRRPGLTVQPSEPRLRVRANTLAIGSSAEGVLSWKGGRAQTRRRDACGPLRGGEPKLFVHRPSACACGTRDAACERCGSVDTCASRKSPSK